MSSDGYFDDEEFDASALIQLDAIEASHFSPRKQTAPAARHPTTSPILAPTKPAAPVLCADDSFCDLSFDVDETALAQLDTFIEEAYQGKAKPVTGPSNMTRTSSSNKLQTTLFGDILQPVASSSGSKAKSQLERTKSTPRNPFGQQAQKTKQWDHTQFAKTGIRKAKSAKGKGKANEEEEEEQEQVEFEQFPAPFVSLGPPPPMKVAADLLEAKHWIFPINRSKRDYQYNIVKNSLFENTLVALPTGLGKTFIAGVVMLNYYRWFPEGKVIFVAPTKPLVSQQVTACHETCGIPGGDSIELTGEVSAAVRARYWKEKRVFFMTPQTLVNDLVKDNCDVRDIVLLVVDEAHRATGDYAYNQVIRFLMAKNPHFRVLALTATPGNNPEAVQLLIDGLHISRIEIRDEQSVDLRAYIHKKVFKPHIITANEGLAKIRDLLGKVMDPLMKIMCNAGILNPGETAVKLHPYRPQAAMSNLKDRRLFAPLSVLAKLARAMMYLLTGSFSASYTFLAEISNEQADEQVEGAKKKNAAGKKLNDDPNFRALMQEFQLQRSRGFSVHPKIEMLKTILIQHFGSKLPEEADAAVDTKVMVFSNYRGVVDEIVEELNKEQPLIRATRFIGQGTDKQGKKGLAQKEQIDVIKRFKAGEFNVLVATSIGEEGLDIGEIDMTVCYDADKAPTRMIQRFGRTGRAREGIIHALLFEGREENNIDKAEASYKEVQKVVNKGVSYELYGDVKRLIPDHIKPQCVEKVVEIEHYVREEGRRKGSPKKAGVKRKRNDDVARNIPDGASTGFVSVRDLVVKGVNKKPKKAAKLPKNFDDQGQDDETDEDIESGRVLFPPRRTQSAAAGASATGKKVPKARLKKSATIASGSKTTKAKKPKKVKESSMSQFSQQGVDDSDDMDIIAGVLPGLKSKPKAVSPTVDPTSPVPELSRVRKRFNNSVLLELTSESEDNNHIPRSPSLKKQIENSVLELSDSEQDEQDDRIPGPSSLKKQIEQSVMELSECEDDSHSPSPKRDKYTFLSPGPAPVEDHREEKYQEEKEYREEDQNMSWLVDDDDDDNRDFEIVDSSPLAPKRTSNFERMEVEDESLKFSELVPEDDFVVATSDTLESMIDESVEFTQPIISPKGKRKAVSIESFPNDVPSLGLRSASRKTKLTQPKTSSIHRPTSSKVINSSPTSIPSSSPLYPEVDQGKTYMLPPALPRRFFASPSNPSLDMPESSYPIRPVGNQAKRRRVIFDETESLSLDLPPLSQRRLHRVESTPVRTKPNKEKSKREKPSLLARNVNPLFDGEAAHSGDEESEGYSDDDEESESDRLFIKNSPATQVPQSYDQSLIYRRSLLTQGPTQGPAFSNRPIRARPFGRVEPMHQNRYLPSSSPPPPDDDLDHYEVGGSFVVDDDEEISYEF